MDYCNSMIVPEFSRKDINDAVSRGELLTMEIEFNSNCDFNCIYCYAENKHALEDELTKKELFDAIIQARDLGVRTMVVLGGEPMLYPHLMEMIRFMRGHGLEVELFTNGANMTIAAAEELFENDVTVVLKMNTFKEALQDKLSGIKGAYRQIQTAFDNLEKSGYPGKDKKLGVSTIICKQNYNEAEKLWKWLRQKDVVPYFEMITPQGRAWEKDALYVEPEQIKELFYRLSDIDKEYGYNWAPRPPLAGLKCLRHQYSCVVKSNGDIYPCIGVDIPVGNIRHQKLRDIIKKSEVIQKLRNYREHIKGPCRECKDLADCYGCRGTAYQLTGDYLASDPLCWKNTGNSDAAATLPCNVDKLVPHESPMLLANRLIEVKETSTVEVDVTDDMVFLRKDGAVEDVAYLEMMAQAIAAHNGFKNSGNGAGTKGFLVGAKNLKIYKAANVGDTLKIAVCKVAQYGDELAVIKGVVLRGKDKLAEGEIKVWHSKETTVI